MCDAAVEIPTRRAGARRLQEEQSGLGKIGGPDSYGQVLSVFVAAGNCINDYDVAVATPSAFAPPLSLLEQIHGETTMAWTGWVFEMKDGKRFAYGSDYTMEFLDLPEGYAFSDVAQVHNHSYLSPSGALVSLEQGGHLPADYPRADLFRPRVYFTCYIDDI